MFVLKKVVTPFLLPPGIFIMVSIFWGVRYLFQKKIRTGIWLVLFGCCMWLMAIAPVSDVFHRALEKDVVIPKEIKGDVLILLGGGANDQASDLTGIGFPAGETLARLITTVRLHHQLHIPIIVSGGQVYSNINSEAQIMRRLLVDLGVSAERIIVEDQSRDTFENALYSIRICKKNNYEAPILVTSAFHLKRAVMNFKKAGMEVVPFPAAYKTWQNRTYGWHDYLPESFDHTQAAIKEYLGLIYTRLFF